ncbi:hypothetical protein PIB30_067110 [Stylosanthes scabra]|uniref:Uncharacterized protein n=1 Tax=Stylosanthes scabra TaxID=79078 RepID=A0ABU6RMH4_9FABA|nr:hypothetical protein [Stylosanthes scabra]
MTITSGRLWMLALPMVPLGRSSTPWCRSNSSGWPNTLLANLLLAFRWKKELSSLKDQVDVLTVERDSVLATHLLDAKIKSLNQELEVSEGERLSALARLKEVEEGARVQAAQLESCWSAIEREKKEAENLTKSLKEKQTALDEVRHLNPVIDYSMISLDTRWDPKAKRIYNPKAEAQEQSEPVVEERLDPEAGVPLAEGLREDVPEGPAGGAEVEEGGGCPV